MKPLWAGVNNVCFNGSRILTTQFSRNCIYVGTMARNHPRSIVQHVVKRYASQFSREKPNLKIPVLDRPIGVLQAPTKFDNSGVDTRTKLQKKADFVDYDKHLQRRRELSHFEDVYKFRDTSGKIWTAPNAYFRADKALYMPNFWGRTLSSSIESGSTEKMYGQVSIVRIFTSLAGENQTKTFFEDINNIKEDGFQIIDINIPENYAKEMIVKLFLSSIKKQFPDVSRHSRYFIARKGISKEIKEAIKLENKYSGYIYLVDKDCKIRWAASGDALDEEKANLWRFVNALNKEQVPKKKVVV